MREIVDYIAEIELALVNSPAVAEYRVIRSWSNADDGYIRIRAALANGDFWEAAEYFVLEEGYVVTCDYRHQWMNSAKTTLRRRWDNTPDHPELENFPHHIHIGDKATVIPGRMTSFWDVLDFLESELSQTRDAL